MTSFLGRLMSHPADRLPPAAAAKLDLLRQQRSDAHAMLQAVSDERSLIGLEKRDKQTAITHLEERYRGPPEVDTNLLNLKAGLELDQAEIRRLSELHDVRSAKWAALSQLVQALETFVASAEHPLKAAPSVSVSIKKGETVLDCVEARRRRLRELASDLTRIHAAPFPSAVVKAKARSEILALAEAGCPDLMSAVEAGDGIRWPTLAGTRQTTFDVAARMPVYTAEAPNALAILAWLNRDQLIAAIEAEIDDVSEDGVALTDLQRAQQVAEVRADRLAVEREEEALIETAATQGLDLLRRPDADPRAVLGVLAS